MDGQWIFDCIVNNSNNYFMWAWHAKGSGTASATLEFAIEDENGYCGFLNLMAHFGGTVL